MSRLLKKGAVYVVATLPVIFCLSCSSRSGNENADSKRRSNYDHEFIISGRANLIAEVEVNQAENWSIKLVINADSTKKQHFNLVTPTLDSAITCVLDKLYKVPYQSPVSANFRYNKNTFELVKAIQGNQIDTLQLRQLLKKSIYKKEERVDLNTLNAYIKPTYDNECEETKRGQKALEKCLKSEVIISAEGKEVKMNHKVFGPWLRLNKAMNVSIDTVAFLGYLVPKINELERALPDLSTLEVNTDTSQLAQRASIPRINVLKEISEIAQLILSGKRSKRVPEWVTVNLLEGIKLGHKEFVEISIEEQRLWLFKNNTLVLETSIVTGDQKRGRDTPKGNYNVKYKARNVVLRGRDYEAFVSYWMPFYGGYGLHDANWRRSFGGTIYARSGSHGCVNMPSKIAPLVFNTIKVGTPVIVR